MCFQMGCRILKDPLTGKRHLNLCVPAPPTRQLKQLLFALYSDVQMSDEQVHFHLISSNPHSGITIYTHKKSRERRCKINQGHISHANTRKRKIPPFVTVISTSRSIACSATYYINRLSFAID